MLSNLHFAYSCRFHNMFVFCLVGVSFNQSTYTVNESSQQVQPVLVLSKPSSVNITVQVTDTASTASK